MTDKARLRDALEASVPEPPKTDRLGGIRLRRRRARRRRNAIVGASAALAIVLVAVTPVVLHGNGSSHDGLASESRDPAYDGPACPPADAGPSGPSTIPDHPLSVRLCPGNGMPIDPPHDALVTGADQVAEVVYDLGHLPAYPACTDELGPGYRLLFAYADGSTASASGELYGCRPVTVGTIARQGADKTLDTFVDLLQEQRTGSAAPDLALAAPTCGRGKDVPPVSLIASPTDMVRGVFCPQDGSASEVPIGDADLRAIVADYARREPHATLEACSLASDWIIEGVTPWGDRTEISGNCRWYVGDGSVGEYTIRDARPVLARLHQEATGR